jgi:hypothetical protein
LTLRRLGIKHQILSPTERNRFCGSRLCPKAPIGPLMHAARFLGKRCKRVRAAAEPGPSAVGVFDRHVVRTWTRDCWGYSFLRPIAAKCNPGASSRSATQCAERIAGGERARRGRDQRVHGNPAKLVTPALRSLPANVSHDTRRQELKSITREAIRTGERGLQRPEAAQPNSSASRRRRPSLSWQSLRASSAQARRTCCARPRNMRCRRTG